MTRKKWTPAEERRLLQLASANLSRTTCFTTFAAETGRSVASIAKHYQRNMQQQAFHASRAVQPSSPCSRQWTPEEDAILSRYIDSSVTNLKACFLAVAEHTGRTPAAVANHWYRVLSKREMHFATISKSHIAKNRKNSEGVPVALSLWQRFLRLIENLHL